MWSRERRLERILKKSSTRDVFLDLSEYLERELSKGHEIGPVGQQVLDLYRLTTEISSDGFSSYLCNPSGDRFREAVEHLHKMRFSELAAQLEKTSYTIFGDRTPPLDQDLRADTFLRFIEHHTEIETDLSEICSKSEAIFIRLSEKITSLARAHKDQLLK